MTMDKIIKLAIVDDHQLFRKGLVSLLSSFVQFEIVIEANNGKDLLNQLQIKKVDVVLLDIQMPIMDGTETVVNLKKTFPSIKIIMISMNLIEEQIRQLINLGVNGYIFKNEEIDVLVTAIETVFRGNFYFDNSISELMFEESIEKKKNNFNSDFVTFTARELAIIQLICMEYSSKEISEKLNISCRTVEGHRERILLKTKVKNIAGIVMYAIKNDLLPPENKFNSTQRQFIA